MFFLLSKSIPPKITELFFSETTIHETSNSVVPLELVPFGYRKKSCQIHLWVDGNLNFESQQILEESFGKDLLSQRKVQGKKKTACEEQGRGTLFP